MIRFCAALFFLAVAGCQEPPELAASDAWVRLPAVPGRPGAAYFNLQAGESPTRLISVSSPVVVQTEMHEMVRANGVMQMRALPTLDVPAGALIRFEPGGRHAMLYHINPGIKPGSKVPLLLTFADGRRVTVNAIARAAGDVPPTTER